jgi:cyclase
MTYMGTTKAEMSSSLLEPGYETVDVADRIIAFIAPAFRGAVVTGNTTVIGGNDSLMVVDSGHFPSLTKRIITQIRHRFQQPPKFVVNTHWHPDHWMGNSLFREAFPGMPILSHVSTRKMIQRSMLDYPEQMSKQFPAILRDTKEAVRNGKRKDGTVLTEEDKRYRSQVIIPDVENFLIEIEKMQVEPPNLTFEEGVNVDLGDREVRVLHLGRGNTAGDVVVYVPDSKILVTGDLVVAPTPFASGSYISEWVETLKKLRAFDATSLVPGHGSVMHDWDYVDTVSGMLKSIADQVQNAVERNAAIPGNSPLSLEDVHKIVELETYEKGMVGEDYFLKLAFQRAFAQPAIARAFLEAKFSEERST